MNEKTEEKKKLEEIEETPEPQQKPEPDKGLQEAVARVEKILKEIRDNQAVLGRNQLRIFKRFPE